MTCSLHWRTTTSDWGSEHPTVLPVILSYCSDVCTPSHFVLTPTYIFCFLLSVPTQTLRLIPVKSLRIRCRILEHLSRIVWIPVFMSKTPCTSFSAHWIWSTNISSYCYSEFLYTHHLYLDSIYHRVDPLHFVSEYTWCPFMPKKLQHALHRHHIMCEAQNMPSLPVIIVIVSNSFDTTKEDCYSIISPKH